MFNQELFNLMQRQAVERKDLAAGTYTAWQPVGEQERHLLMPYDGDYEKAPSYVREEISALRHEFFQEWGSEGKRVTFMNERHAQERHELGSGQFIEAFRKQGRGR